MDTEVTGREKTYLVLISFLIIANMFIPITFDKINILGNEANVPDGFVKSTVFLMWLYFLWIFYQLTYWKYNERYKSEIFTGVLQKYSGNKIIEYAVKSGLYESEDQVVSPGEASLINPLTFIDSRRVKDGFEITAKLHDDSGDIEEHHFTIPSKEMRGSIFLANVVYIIKDSSFSRYTFPYVIAALAAASAICQILKFLLC